MMTCVSDHYREMIDYVTNNKEELGVGLGKTKYLSGSILNLVSGFESSIRASLNMTSQ